MKIIKLLILTLFCGLMLLGCLPDEKPKCKINQIDGNPKSIIGTWQLVSKEYINQELGVTEFTDFSCDGVFYKFFENGKFLVLGDHPEIPNYSTDSYEFKYGEIKDNYYPSNSTLSLSSPSYPCVLESSQMTIDRMYLDGSKFIFYRVNDFTDN